MTGKEVNMVLQALGWKPDPGVKLTLLKKRSVLVELLEKLPVVNEADIGKHRVGHSNLEVHAQEVDMMLQELAEYVLQIREASSGSSASVAAASASGPVTPSVPRNTEKDRSPEGEKLQRHINKMMSQLSYQRRQTVARDTDMPDTRSARMQPRQRYRSRRRSSSSRTSRTPRRPKSRTRRRRNRQAPSHRPLR